MSVMVLPLFIYLFIYSESLCGGLVSWSWVDLWLFDSPLIVLLSKTFSGWDLDTKDWKVVLTIGAVHFLHHGVFSNAVWSLHTKTTVSHFKCDIKHENMEMMLFQLDRNETDVKHWPDDSVVSSDCEAAETQAGH